MAENIQNIPKRISGAILNSLASGVVPRTGLEYIAIGRTREIAAILEDLDTVSAGGSAFRMISGRYGSGKSFLIQLMRAHAMERGFAVADADLSPERRLAGSNKQGLATYRELLRNLSTRAAPDGGALAVVLTRWISKIQVSIAREKNLAPGSQALADAIHNAVEPSMAQRAWNGEEITMSAVALTQAVDAMAQAAEDYILTNCPPDASGPDIPETPETPEASQPDSVSMQYVFDISHLLTFEEWEELETRAADISSRQHCGVYLLVFPNRTQRTHGSLSRHGEGNFE